MNYTQLYLLGFSIMLLSSLFHALIYGSQPMKGLYLLAEFIGLTIVLTTAALESKILENVNYKNE